MHCVEDEPVSVLIVDPYKNVSLRVANLSVMKSLRIVALVDRADKAVDTYFRLKPDVVLLDYNSRLQEGIQTTRAIMSGDPEAAVIVLLDRVDSFALFGALNAGARGVCLNSADTSRMRAGIGCVSKGDTWIDSCLLQPLVTATLGSQLSFGGSPEPGGSEAAVQGARIARAEQLSKDFAGSEQPGELLSERELNVLKLVAEGYSNKRIATELMISRDTVKSHLKKIMRRLEVSDRTEAAVKAIRLELI